MKKTFKLFMTFAIILLLTNKISAQQKYDFMAISLYNAPLSCQINTSINGEEFTSEDVKKDKGSKDLSNLNPLFRKIKEFQDKNWEVMNFNTVLSAGSSVGIMYIAFLRKKIE